MVILAFSILILWYASIISYYSLLTLQYQEWNTDEISNIYQSHSILRVSMMPNKAESIQNTTNTQQEQSETSTIDKYLTPNEKGQRRIIRYKMNGSGFANNMYGLVSAYLIAELLHAELILEPSNTFQFVFKITDLRGNPIEEPNLVYSREGWTNMRFEYDCVYKDKKMTKLFIEHPLEEVFKNRTINFYSNCPLFSWMALNRDTYNRIVDLGLLDVPYGTRHHSIDGFMILSKILREHFEMTDLVKDYVSYNLGNVWDPTNRIGIHIRKGDETSDFQEYHHFLEDSDISSFVHCDVIRNFTNPQLYLASDSQNAKRLFHESNNEFGYNVISSWHKAKHTSYYSGPKAPTKTLYYAVADLMSIAQSAVVIGTQDSSYSIVAAAFQGNVPYLVSKGQGCKQLDELVYYSV